MARTKDFYLGLRIRDPMAKRKRSKKAVKKKAYYSGRKEKRAKKR